MLAAPLREFVPDSADDGDVGLVELFCLLFGAVWFQGFYYAL